MEAYNHVNGTQKGGNWGGAQGVDDSIFPQTLEIDYVRVYQAAGGF